MIKNKLFLITFLVFFLVFTSSVNADWNIMNCQDLDIQGETYILQANITTSGTCFVIEVDNITLDLNGYTITGDGTGRGVLIEEGNDFFTIKNGEISNFNKGIEGASCNNGIIQDNKIINNINGAIMIFTMYGTSDNHNIVRNIIENNGLGIDLTESNNNIIINNKLTNNLLDGIDLSNSNNNTLNKNRIENNGWEGIDLNDGDDNIIRYNNIDGNGQDGIDLNDANNNIIADNKINNNDIDGINLDESLNNTIKNNNIENNEHNGIDLREAHNTIINSNDINNNGYGGLPSLDYSGIELDKTEDNIIKNNYIRNNNLSGIYLLNNATNNLIYNNILNNNQNVGHWSVSPWGSNYWNIDLQTGPNIIHGLYLGGNYWAKPDGIGFSQICEDLDYNGICDDSYIIDDFNIDYLPLTLIEHPLNVTIINPIEGSTITSNSTMLEVTTNENAVCEYALARFMQYNGTSGWAEPFIPQNMSVTGRIYHQQLITGLYNTINNATQSAWYTINVDCTDYIGNSGEDSVIFYVNIIEDEI